MVVTVACRLCARGNVLTRFVCVERKFCFLGRLVGCVAASVAEDGACEICWFFTSVFGGGLAEIVGGAA